MEPKARHVLIGLFTVGVFVFALIFGLWLTHLNAFQDSYRYRVHFRESISGLSKGSAVLFNGMNVGEVLDLWLDKEDTSNVYAEISVRKDIPVREGVEAKLQLMGITGQSVIALKGGKSTAPRLVAEGTIFQTDDDLPTISATPSPLSALLEDGQNVVSNFTEVSIGLKNLFSDSNVKHFGEIISNLNRLSGAVASEDKTIKELIKQTNTMLKNANTMVDSFKQLASQTNQMLSAEGQKALGSMVQAMGSLSNASQKIQSLVVDNEANLSQGLQGFKELTPAIIEFKRAFGTLQNILQNLEDRPAGYFIDGDTLKDFKP